MPRVKNLGEWIISGIDIDPLDNAVVRPENVGDEHTSWGNIFMEAVEIVLFKNIVAQANMQFK